MDPKNEERLRQAHLQGLQRLLSFEADGGGFGWYGGREGNTILTAYAAMYLADLAKVYDYDRRILDRTLSWLEKAQDPQGRWKGLDGHSTWARLSDAAVPSTAYVAWAFRRAGREDTPAMGKALEFLKKNLPDDAYALALVANAFPARDHLGKLAELSKDGRWTTRLQSWNHARGESADVETTALAVLALAQASPGLADRGAAWLVRARAPHGGWGSTQATVLALQALAATSGVARDRATARLWVNGREVADAFGNVDEPTSFDISPHLKTGANEVTVETSTRMNAQVAGLYYVPWGAGDMLRGVEGLNLQVSYDRLEAKVNETVRCTVKVEADAFMVIAEVALPPGFTVDRSDLDDLVRRRQVDKVTQTGRQLTFYLPGKSATLTYGLKPRYPARVSVPRSVAYEYYTPDRRVIAPPVELSVQ